MTCMLLTLVRPPPTSNFFLSLYLFIFILSLPLFINCFFVKRQTNGKQSNLSQLHPRDTNTRLFFMTRYILFNHILTCHSFTFNILFQFIYVFGGLGGANKALKDLHRFNFSMGSPLAVPFCSPPRSLFYNFCFLLSLLVSLSFSPSPLLSKYSRQQKVGKDQY